MVIIIEFKLSIKLTSLLISTLFANTLLEYFAIFIKFFNPIFDPIKVKFIDAAEPAITLIIVEFSIINVSVA